MSSSNSHLPVVKIGDKSIVLNNPDASDDLQIQKKPKKILDEETYSENVERIIVRDFFPDHDQLKDQKEYLEAEERKDFERMRQIALKYAAAGGTQGSTPATLKYTPLPSPATFETPLQDLKRPGTEQTFRSETISNNSNQTEHNLGYDKKETEIGEEPNTVNKKDASVGLDKFLSKYTSEDNDSFESIMKRSEQARKDKHAWLYEAEKRHAETTKEILMLESTTDKPLAITDGVQNAGDVDGDKKAVRSTVPINTWEYKNKNTLMYYPEGLENTDDDGFKKPLLIQHQNTRFKKTPFKDVLIRSKLAEKMNENKNTGGERIGHDGKSIIPQESPRVGGYGFVATPSPMPGVEDSPLMTWGEIDSTPARLETATPGPAFRFPEESERDKLTHKMVDANTKKHRAKKQAALKQVKASVLGTPKFGSIMSSERINLLSPAARRLVSKRFNLGSDRALKASYTPSSSRRRRNGGETPIVKTPTPRKTKNTPTPGTRDITDNLLNIPNTRRKTAADFF